MSDDKPGTDPEKNLETVARAPGSVSKEPVRIQVNSRVDPLIGTTVMGYVVRGKIGSGGMGLVYQGEQPVIGKKVAIKVLKPEIAENPEQVKRLVAEARAVNAVGHRGIIDIFGYDELPDGRQCIVMELLEGEALSDLLARQKESGEVLPLFESMIILEEVLSALSAAHGAGVVHRDLKPSNIFLCRQRDGARHVKVLDFGIAKLDVYNSSPATNPSITVGTPSYMPPEQAAGGKVTPAMDLYALGVIAFEMLTNQLPFLGESVVDVLMKHAEEKPARPSSLVMSIPDEADELVLQLLEKKPEDRPATAESVRVDVVRVRKILSESTARASDPPPAVLPEKNVLLSRSLMDQELSGSDTTAKNGFQPVAEESQEVTFPPNVPAGPDDETVLPRSRPKRNESKKRLEPLPEAEGDKTDKQDVTMPPLRRDLPRQLPAPRSNRGLYLGLAGLALGVIALVISLTQRQPEQPQQVVVVDMTPTLNDPLLPKLQAAEAAMVKSGATEADQTLVKVRGLIKKLNDGSLDAVGRKDAEALLSQLK